MSTQQPSDARNNVDLSLDTSGSVRSHALDELQSESSQRRRETHETKLTDAGHYEKKTSHSEKVESESSVNQVFQAGNAANSMQAGSQRPDAENQASARERSGGRNLPDLDELADRIAASRFGGLGEGMAAGFGGSGSDSGISSSPGDKPDPPLEGPCEGLTGKEKFCCENPNSVCCNNDDGTGGDGCKEGQCAIPEGSTENPIRYSNGELRLSVNDLSASRFSGSWAHRRAYSNQMSQNFDYGNGFNWIVGEWGYLNEASDGTITVVRGPGRNLWFELDGVGGYAGRFGALSTLTHDRIAGTFVLTSPDGDQLAFHDFDQLKDPPGLFAWKKDVGGGLTEVNEYTEMDRIGEVQRSIDQDGQTITESLIYDYFNSGDQRGRLRHVTLRRKVDDGDWQDIQRAKYDYYASSDAGGSVGDLRRARQQELAADDTTWQDTNVHYYRYYTAGDAKGFAHALKYVVEPESYSRLADVTDPLTASDGLVAQYADNYFEYNSARRVTKEIVQAGAMTFTLQYSSNDSSSDDYNQWRRKTIETRPDGSQNIVFTNYIGQVLLKELRSGTGAERWIQSLRYNDDGQIVERSQPSAVVDYDESANDLAVTLQSDEGLIHLSEYYTESNSSGAAKGYVKSEKVKRGSDGSAVLLRSIKYATHTAGGTTVHPLSYEIVYRNDDGSGELTTHYDHQYHAGTVAVAQRTTTLPVIQTDQNSDDSTGARTERFDIHGNRTWVRDERGTITHTVYDALTGTMTRQIVDVDASQVVGVPFGWTTPSGGGLHLVTDYQHDNRGRITQSLGPVHSAEVDGVARQVRRARWQVYFDNDHQQWTGQGYHDEAADTDTLVGPVSIIKQNHKGHPVEQISAVRSSSAGKLTASDTFAQSDYVRWTTLQYSDCCTLISQRVYHTIPSSGEGSSGTNYNETQFGYDSLKRRNRTVSPGGTIRFAVFDVRGQQTGMYAGTNDSGATQRDPTGGGASGNDMLLMNEQQYDFGDDGGDGLLTRTTQHVDASTNRMTDYGYDWRGRQVMIDGGLDFYQVTTLDNLGRVLKSERFDTSSSGNLVSREETKYDNRGRVYQRIRHEVDPTTGSVTGNQTQDMYYDAAGNLIKQEPAGSMEYQTFICDSLNRRIEATDPLGQSQQYSYDAVGNQTAMTDQVGSVWTKRYDAIGRQVESLSPLGQSTTYGFDDAGHQSTVTNGAGETTASVFDAADRTIESIDPLSKSTTYVYDANGNQTSVTDPNGNTRTSVYDYLNRLVKVSDPLGHETEMAYNMVGELVLQTDAKGNDTLHAYDALGRETSVTDRLGHSTTFDYTVLGQLESLTDAENQTTSYRYDGYGRQVEVVWPDHVPGSSPGDLGYGITATAHDVLNRVTQTTDQLGDTVTFNYDVAGRMLSRDYRTRVNSPSGTIADSDTFTYDAASRMLTANSGRYGNNVALAYDIAGRKTSESLTISGQTYTTSTDYDSAGRISKLIYPDSSEIVRTYTGRGQLEKIIAGGIDLDTRSYDDGGRMTSSVYDNGVSETRTYNTDGTLLEINFTGASIGQLSYSWDENHNKTSEQITGTMSDYGYTASYDAEDHLVAWDRADANLDQSWALSPVGDWQKFTENTVIQNRTHGPAHELTAAGGQSVQHDAKGNMTYLPDSLTPSLPLSLHWDFDNRLSSADVDNDGSDDVFYQFDALGRRVARTASSTTTVYVPNGQQTLADYASGASPSSPQYTYAWGSYIDELIVRDGSGGQRFYHRNQQFSIIALTDLAGAITERYAYDAYGELTITDSAGAPRSASTESNRYLYTGREWDEALGLYHYRARIYDPVAGRFCSRDPIGYWDSANLYQYVTARPTNAVDSLGLQTVVAPPKSPITFPNRPFPTNIPSGPRPPVTGGVCRAVVTRIPHVAVFCGGVVAGKCVADKCELVKTYIDITYWICDSDRDAPEHECPPCPLPPPAPRPRVDRVPPSRPHFPCKGDHLHTYWYETNQEPYPSCVCHDNLREHVKCL